MNRHDFLEGMSHAASTVSVITTDGPRGRRGVTVSAMCSVSADPPSLLVCVHHQSKACEALLQNGVLCVNVLRDDQSHVSDTFAGRIPPPGGDHFACASWTSGDTGAPVLQDALATFDCIIARPLRFGSHYVFLSEVKDIRYRPQGRALIYANRAYGTPANLEHFVSDDQATTALRVGCFVTLGPFFMPKLMAAYAQLHPEVRFELHEGAQDRLAEGLRARRFDLGLMYAFGELPDIETEVLAEGRPHVLLPAAHPLTRSAHVALAELVNEPMVLLDIPPSRDYFTGLFTPLGLAPRIAVRSPSFEMVRGLVGNGFGYTLLVSKPANAMTYDGWAVVSRPIADEVEPASIALAHRHDIPLRGALAGFAEHCRQFFQRWHQ